MVAEQSGRPTGYPPVTKIEEQKAAEKPAPALPEASRLHGDGKLIVDALAAVFDEHRQRVGEIALAPEGKRYALDLLDVVFLDVLQVVLNEAPTVERFHQRDGARSSSAPTRS